MPESCNSAPARRRQPLLRVAALRALPVMMAFVLAACGGLPEQPDAAAPGGSAPPAASAPAVAASPAGASFPPGVLYRLLVAEFAGRRGQLPVAVDSYLEVARATRDPAVAERAARVAVYARDQEKGLEAAALWVAIAPENLDARRVNAALLLRAQRTGDAVAQLEAIVEGWNEPAGRGIGLVAELLARERDKARALDVMQRLVASRAGDAKAQFALARLATRLGKPEQALETLERALELDPTDTKAMIFYARVLRSQEQVEPALRFLNRSLDTVPDAHDVRMTYARMLVDTREYEQARNQFQRLVDARPQEADARYALGLLLLQTEDRPAARAQFEKLLELGKRKLSAHYYLGQIAEGEKDYGAALASYRRVDRGDHYLSAQVRIASVYAQQGNLDKARSHLHGIQRNSTPDDIRIYRAEAELLVQAERLDEALRVYDAALVEHPKHGDLLYARAMVAARADRIDILERDLRDILSREPNNADALNALGYTLADRTDRFDEAMALVKRAFELKPNDHYIMDSMGWILYRLGRYDEAVEHLRKAISIRQDAEIAAHLGEVLWVLGKKQEARQVWEAALEQTPDDERLLETIKRFSGRR